jgi:RNA polymerase sigma-70 factor, ECF subfamily
MSSRITRLMFGLLPARLADFGDSCVSQIPPAGEMPISARLGQRLSDETLAEHLQRGNAEALTLLFERYSPLLYGIARRILRNEAEAEDAVQQVFLDIFRFIHQFNPEKGTFRTWLLMYGYQRILNCRRAMIARRFFSSDPWEDPQSNRLAAKDGRTLGYSEAEMNLLIEKVLQHLQVRQRRTIELVYYEGLTTVEVAKRTGETVRVVRHNLYRGLEKLRQTLSRGSGKSLDEDCR